ncbi:hypothetical protein M9H77_23753 [Catharanthus roseus]|uniref:Uncharacterized protein n=1 Tax=Catharanthus roseus TaxID=4058 RepID=A0ACC0AVW2_CATRO|nr:hypothetical protein M9H77_23753 [Catharanthus roseus]
MLFPSKARSVSSFLIRILHGSFPIGSFSFFRRPINSFPVIFSCQISSLSHQNRRRSFFDFRRFESTKTQEEAFLHDLHKDEHDDTQTLEFPGGKVGYTSHMKFLPESSDKRIPCYRVLDDDGYLIMGSEFEQVSKEVGVKMYSDMVTLEMMDSIFYEAQKQGRISFYLTSTGEEAINIASAAALAPDDVVLSQKNPQKGADLLPTENGIKNSPKEKNPSPLDNKLIALAQSPPRIKSSTTPNLAVNSTPSIIANTSTCLAPPPP